MVSSGIVALLALVAVQAVQGSFLPYGDCGCDVPPPPPPPCGCLPPPPPPCPKFEVGCCPGPVVEKKCVTQKPVQVPYTYSVPTFSKKCFIAPAGVDKKVIPSSFQTCPVCETQTTVIKVPTKEVEVKEQPLCKRTCTTSEYLIQIPIIETTCTNTPLCKKCTRTQENVLNICASKTACQKQVCNQANVIETPLTKTVCQDYQGSVCKVGAKTVLKPEIKKTCVQLPPYKCLKPVTPYGFPSYAGYGDASPYGLDAPGYASYPGPLYGADYSASLPIFPAPSPSCDCTCN